MVELNALGWPETACCCRAFTPQELCRRCREEIAPAGERISVIDQNGGGFYASTVGAAIRQCFRYLEQGDTFRIYVIDNENPYPGYLAMWVHMEEGKPVITRKG